MWQKKYNSLCSEIGSFMQVSRVSNLGNLLILTQTPKKHSQHCSSLVQDEGHWSVPALMGVAEIDGIKAATTAKTIAEEEDLVVEM